MSLLAPTTKASPLSPTPFQYSPTKKWDLQNTSPQQTPATQKRKKMGIAAALLLVFFASLYDMLDIASFVLSLFTVSIAEWIMYIVDFIYIPINVGFWLYFRTKKINRRGLWILSSIVEFLPIIDVLNFQTVWALVIIWTNMTKTGERIASSVPAPKINPRPKAA